MGILTKLDELEEKIDACLILLRMATSHDDFSYTLEDTRRNYKVSERWQKQMEWSRSVASRVLLPGEKHQLKSGRSVPFVPPEYRQDKLTTDMAGNRETSPKPNGRKARQGSKK
jgi:hypothetical protein